MLLRNIVRNKRNTLSKFNLMILIEWLHAFVVQHFTLLPSVHVAAHPFEMTPLLVSFF
jgi:hypothetical protein